jgi:hypothetical protein
MKGIKILGPKNPLGLVWHIGGAWTFFDRVHCFV